MNALSIARVLLAEHSKSKTSNPTLRILSLILDAVEEGQGAKPKAKSAKPKAAKKAKKISPASDQAPAGE